jgi:hypothetical protein
MNEQTAAGAANRAERIVTYREVRIGGTLYLVTGVFSGEKELGPTLEKLAAEHVLREMEKHRAGPAHAGA